MRALEEGTTTPVFYGSRYSSKSATYTLFSEGELNGVSNTCLDELFRVLSSAILPQPNSLLKSYREALEYLSRLGHSYKSYDACPNNFCLFKGDIKDAVVCPNCRAPR